MKQNNRGLPTSYTHCYLKCLHSNRRWLLVLDDENDTQNQYCINEECSGYDTEDELFDLARGIIERSCRQEVGEVCLIHNNIVTRK